MSEKNVEVVRRAIAALGDKGVDGLLAFSDPEVELITPASLASEPGTYRGRDGVRGWFDSFNDAMDGVTLEGRDYMPVGDQVLVQATLRARGRATGIETEQSAFLLCTVRDDRVTKLEGFAERDEALEAAGPDAA